MHNVLWGVVCLDHYTATGEFLPGCGILHNAYHLQRLGSAPLLVTRLGDQDAETALHFLSANQIKALYDGMVVPGATARIDIAVRADGIAHISGFRPGVWSDYHVLPGEAAALSSGDHLHVVLTGPVIPEFMRLATSGALAAPLVSADLLALHDFDFASFSAILPYVDLIFVGWQGAVDAPELAALGQTAAAHDLLAIFTLGARGQWVVDQTRGQRMVAVESVPVTGSTNGCGDAFISYFLDEYWRSRDLGRALARGQAGGAAATHWRYALPDEAYARTAADTLP